MNVKDLPRKGEMMVKVKEVTLSLLEEPKEEKKVLSPEELRLQRIADLIPVIGGCSRADSLRELVSLVIGEELPEPVREGGEEGSFDNIRKNWLCVVPLTNDNSHNYPLNVPCVVLDADDRRALRMDNTVGNHLDGGGKRGKDFRIAIEKEIDYFFKKLGKVASYEG